MSDAACITLQVIDDLLIVLSSVLMITMLHYSLTCMFSSSAEDGAAGGAMISHAFTEIYKTFLIHTFASSRRPNLCSHRRIPPRGPASPIQLVCHKPVSCNPPSVTQHHSISSSSLGIRLVVCADLVPATSYPEKKKKTAVCSEYISGKKATGSGLAFHPLFRAVVAAIF